LTILAWTRRVGATEESLVLSWLLQGNRFAARGKAEVAPAVQVKLIVEFLSIQLLASL
jgi:hypothetical protein